MLRLLLMQAVPWSCNNACRAKRWGNRACVARPPPHPLSGPTSSLHRLVQASELGTKIDTLYSSVFMGVEIPQPTPPPPTEVDDKAAAGAEAAAALQAQLAQVLPDPSQLTEAGFGELGRSAPKVRCT